MSAQIENLWLAALIEKPQKIQLNATSHAARLK